MSNTESKVLQDCIAVWGEKFLSDMLESVELTTADGQTVTVPAGALRHPSSYPSSIRVTVEGVEYEIFDDVVAYIKAKLMERQP